MEDFKDKLIIKKACWAFGAFETGKKLREDKKRIKILISLLIEQDMHPQAFIIARDFLSKEEIYSYESTFEMVPKDISKKKVYAEAHEALTNENILVTKKRLRQLKKKLEVKQKREAEKLRRKNRAMRNPEMVFVKKSEVVKAAEAIQATKEHKLASVEDFGYEHKKTVLFIPNLRALKNVTEHFLEQKILGFDSEFKGLSLSTIQLASHDKVAIFDVNTLGDHTEFTDFMKQIMIDSEISLVAHTFKTDGYVIHQNFKMLDPYQMKHIYELNELILEQTTGKKIGMIKMAEMFLNTTMTKSYQRTNWLRRPLTDDQIAYAALDAILPLKIFEKFSKGLGSSVSLRFYSYQPPEVLPKDIKAKKKKKKKKRKQKKKEKEGSQSGSSAGGTSAHSSSVADSDITSVVSTQRTHRESVFKKQTQATTLGETETVGSNLRSRKDSFESVSKSLIVGGEEGELPRLEDLRSSRGARPQKTDRGGGAKKGRGKGRGGKRGGKGGGKRGGRGAYRGGKSRGGGRGAYRGGKPRGRGRGRGGKKS